MKITMPTIAAALMLTASIGHAQSANWVPLGNSMYLLVPTDGQKIYLSAGIDTRTKDVAINLFDLTGTQCKEGESQESHSATPLKIDGKYVQFMNACINGTVIGQPTTDAGKAFLNGEVASGVAVTIETGLGPVLHYPPANLAAVRAKLMEAKKAM